MPKGPCIVCGAINYPLSCGGPDICPPCDLGVPPEVSRLREENMELRNRIIALEIEKNGGSIFIKGTDAWKNDPNRIAFNKEKHGDSGDEK